MIRRRASANYQVRRAADRYRSAVPGITSYHSFSAAAHYDPDNTGFGPLIGIDEHTIEPGTGFAEHAHRGVEILSWVLAGRLRHEDAAGQVRVLGPGVVLHQSSGAGIRHSEVNDSDSEPLRLVQMTLLGGVGAPRCRVTKPPLLVPGAGILAVLVGPTEIEARAAYLHVTRGAFSLLDHPLEPGDAVRAERSLTLAGAGELLAWVFPSPHVAVPSAR